MRVKDDGFHPGIGSSAAAVRGLAQPPRRVNRSRVRMPAIPGQVSRRGFVTPMLHRNKTDWDRDMGEIGFFDREARTLGWRGIASAWAIVLLILALFAGFDVLASLRPAPAHAVGIMIPRHDPACDAAVGVATLPKACVRRTQERPEPADLPWG
jgi:hypothetical protein